VERRNWPRRHLGPRIYTSRPGGRRKYWYLVLLLPCLLLCNTHRAAFPPGVPMCNGAPERCSPAPSMPYLTSIAHYRLGSFSPSLLSPYYRALLRHTNWHHCIRGVVRGNTDLTSVPLR
jgi:hypothetical protein